MPPSAGTPSFRGYPSVCPSSPGISRRRPPVRDLCPCPRAERTLRSLALGCDDRNRFTKRSEQVLYATVPVMADTPETKNTIAAVELAPRPPKGTNGDAKPPRPQKSRKSTSDELIALESS